MATPNRLGLNQVSLQKRGTGDGKDIILEVFGADGKSYELTVAGNLKPVNRQAVRPGVETAVFPNASNRQSVSPKFIGQVGIQMDTGQLYYGTSVTLGGWAAIPGTSVWSVFGRVGAVVAQAGDYDESQIANLRWRPPVTNLVNLPLAGNTVNDIRLVTAIGTMYRWNGVAWVQALTIIGTLEFQGLWNASTNAPPLASGVGTKGYYYVVNVAGSTPLDGITDWEVGDWAIFNGTAWQKIDNTEEPESVFVFRPGVAPDKPNVYDVWGSLYADLQARGGSKIIVFDDAGVGLGNPIPLPAGSYDMKNVEWHGIFDGPHLNTGGSLVYLADGVVLTNLNRLDNLLRVYTEATTVEPITVAPGGFETMRLGHASGIFAGASGGTKSFVKLGATSNFWFYLEGCSILAGSIPTFDFGADDGHLHVQMLDNVSYFNGNTVRGTNPAAQVTAETTAIDTQIDRTQPSYAGTFTIKDVRLSMMDTWVLDDGASDPLPAGVLSSWVDLMDSLALYQNNRPLKVEIRSKNVSVPAGSYGTDGVKFIARDDALQSREVSLNEVQLTSLESDGLIDWINKNTAAPVITVGAMAPGLTHKTILRNGSRMLSHVTATKAFLQVDAGGDAVLDLGAGCQVDQNGGAVEAVSNDGTLNIYARDNAQVTNQTLTATAAILGHMIGPASYISTFQASAAYPLLIVDRSKPRLDWDYVEVGGGLVLAIDDLDKVYGTVCTATVIDHALPKVLECGGRRVTFKIVDDTGGAIRLIPFGSDSINGFQNYYVMGGPGNPSVTLQSDGGNDWKVVATGDNVEQSFVREMVIPSIGGEDRYRIPVSSLFFDAATESTLEIDTGGGFVQAVYGVDYTHLPRGYSRPGPDATVLDEVIGFRLLAGGASGGWTFRFRWVERRIRIKPEGVAAVRLDGGGALDTGTKWLINNSAQNPNGFSAGLPSFYCLELWRLMRRRGGAGTGDFSYGRRFVPYLRNPVGDNLVNLQPKFKIGKGKRNLKLCFFNPVTGARSDLCTEMLYFHNFTRRDDALGSSGYFRTKEGACWVI